MYVCLWVVFGFGWGDQKRELPKRELTKNYLVEVIPKMGLSEKGVPCSGNYPIGEFPNMARVS